MKTICLYLFLLSVFVTTKSFSQYMITDSIKAYDFAYINKRKSYDSDKSYIFRNRKFTSYGKGFSNINHPYKPIDINGKIDFFVKVNQLNQPKIDSLIRQINSLSLKSKKNNLSVINIINKIDKASELIKCLDSIIKDKSEEVSSYYLYNSIYKTNYQYKPYCAYTHNKDLNTFSRIHIPKHDTLYPTHSFGLHKYLNFEPTNETNSTQKSINNEPFKSPYNVDLNSSFFQASYISMIDDKLDSLKQTYKLSLYNFKNKNEFKKLMLDNSFKLIFNKLDKSTIDSLNNLTLPPSKDKKLNEIIISLNKVLGDLSIKYQTLIQFKKIINEKIHILSSISTLPPTLNSINSFFHLNQEKITIDLTANGPPNRDFGDVIYFRHQMMKDSSKIAIEEEQFVFTVRKFGLYSSISSGFNITADQYSFWPKFTGTADSTVKTTNNPKIAISGTFLLNWGTAMKKFKKFQSPISWGLHFTLFPKEKDISFGLGTSVHLLDNFVQIGYGYNVSEEYPYFMLGTNIIDIVKKAANAKKDGNSDIFK